MSDRIRKPQKCVALSDKNRPISRYDAQLLNTFLYMIKNSDEAPSRTKVTTEKYIVPRAQLSRSESALYKELYKASNNKSPLAFAPDPATVSIEVGGKRRVDFKSTNGSEFEFTPAIETGDRINFEDSEGSVWSFDVSVILSSVTDGVGFSSCANIKRNGQPQDSFEELVDFVSLTSDLVIFEGGWNAGLTFPLTVPALGTTQLKDESFAPRLGKYEVELYYSFKAMLAADVKPR